MPYERLRTSLAEREAPTFSTLPDGSIDRYCTLSAGDAGPLRTHRSLGRELVQGVRSSFEMRVEGTEPGGQAVNVAQQLHALGGDVACYGHLDAPVFDGLAFETVSMGEPAEVYAFNFEDGDIMFVENEPVAGWTLADLRRVADLPDVFGVDVVCCGNWVSFPGMDDAFRRLGGMDLPRVPFVLDPGDVLGSTSDELDALREGLSMLQNTFDVVYNANRREVRATAAALSDPPEDDDARLAAVREATGIEAAVMHAEDEAVAATRSGLTAVENLAADQPARHTGGGDHFTGGLAYGLAHGWDWDLALACGNACAVHYVETAEAGTVGDVRAMLERKTG